MENNQDLSGFLQKVPNVTMIPSVFAIGGNPKFNAFLQKMKTMHDKKNKDYAQTGNPYSNFEEAAATAGLTVDAVFRTLIGIKLARLKELQTSGKTPTNESVQDSILDLAVYSALWASYYEEVKG